MDLFHEISSVTFCMKYNCALDTIVKVLMGNNIVQPFETGKYLGLNEN